MKQTIYHFRDYKLYLKDWLSSQPAGGYGLRGQMAEAMGCQTAFVSQVLKGESHLSLEQADKLNPLLGHAKQESAFFLLLVQFTRAGSDSLRAHFLELIEATVERQTVLKERLSSTQKLSEEDHSVYFSSWIYAAVHSYLMIPPYQTKASIAKALRIPLRKVGTVLEFLSARGLAQQSGDHYSVGPIHIHLGNDSSMITKHHLNWRLQAMQAIEADQEEGVHYSSVICIGEKDAQKLKIMIGDFLAGTRRVITDSKEEELHGFCVDFFKLG
ncbi:MAG: TIGR02147 family protein [Bacteriovoracia bacterium]